MLIAGIEVADAGVLEVAALLREKRHDKTAFRLELSLYAGRRKCRLSHGERNHVLDALHDHPCKLSNLRTALHAAA
jgi:hypothetical protein